MEKRGRKSKSELKLALKECTHLPITLLRQFLKSTISFYTKPIGVYFLLPQVPYQEQFPEHRHNDNVCIRVVRRVVLREPRHHVTVDGKT